MNDVLMNIYMMGSGIMAGVLVVLLLINMVAVYLGGKVVRSPRSGFLSAAKAVLFLFLFTLVLSVLTILFNYLGVHYESMTSLMKGLNYLISIGFLAGVFFILKKIYELGVVRTVLLFLVSALISILLNVILMGAVGGSFLMSQKDKLQNFGNNLNPTMIRDVVTEKVNELAQ